MNNIYRKFFLFILSAIVLTYFILNFTPYFFRKISNNKSTKSTSENINDKSVIDPKIYTSNPKNIIKLLKQYNENKEHPRLMARERDFKNIKSQINNNMLMKKNFNYLKKQADIILDEKPVRYKITDNSDILYTSRRVLYRIQTLSFMYKISNEKKYAHRAWLELEAISNNKTFPNWNPSHFLDTAEMTNAASIGYDWLYNYLSEKQRSVIRNAILNKGLKPAMEFYSKNNSPMKGDNNWNSVCNGGISMGALAIGDEGGEFTSTSSKILENSIKYLPVMLNNYTSDGAWYEGTTYWDYGTTYVAYFISALDSSLGTDYGLSQSSGLASTGYFPIYMSSSAGMFNFADSKVDIVKSPVLLWLSNKFKNGDYKLYYDKKINTKDINVMSFIWGNKNKNIKETKLQKQDKYFKGLESVGLHSSLLKSDDYFIGFKAGTNNLNHSDLDIGTFVYDSFGIRWFCELGPENYTLPDYWNMKEDGTRWEYYRKRAEGQNTLVINPSSKPDQNVYAKTKIETFKSGSKKSFAIADITDAYNNDALSVKRGVALFKNNGKMIVQDEILNYDPSNIWWFAHTQAKININEDKKSAILSKNGKKILVSIVSPVNGYFDKMNAEPLPSSPNPFEQSPNNVEKLAIHLTNVKSTTISVIISPLTDYENLSPTNLIKLKDWNTDN